MKINKDNREEFAKYFCVGIGSLIDDKAVSNITKIKIQIEFDGFEPIFLECDAFYYDEKEGGGQTQGNGQAPGGSYLH